MLLLRLSVVASWILTGIVVTGCASLSRGKLDESVLAARQLSLRGTDAAQHGEWGDAEKYLSEAVQTCPMDERMRCQYAETLWNLGAFGEAIDHMEFAAKLSGGNPDVLVRLGDMYLQKGELQRAAEHAERAIAANRRLACAWALRGDVLQRQGDEQQALASYHRALSYQEHYPRVQLAIAECYRRQGRHSRVLGTLQSLADGYPAGEVPAEVQFQEGLAQKELGRYEAAIASLSQAARTSPPSPELLYHLGETYLRMHDTANARIAVKAALALEPAHRRCQQLLAQLETLERNVAVAAHPAGRQPN